MDRFNSFGAALATFGAALSLFSYLVLGSVPMTALGIGAVVVGLSMLITPTEPVPRRAVRALLEGSILNIEALLEEVDASLPGYYVLHGDGRVYVHAPLTRDAGPPSPGSAPRGVMVAEGGEPYLVLLPPASELVRLGDLPEDLDSAVSEALVDLTELCESVKVARGEELVLEIKKPRAIVGAERFRRVLGSLEASVAACVAAAVLKRPVRVASEVDEGRVRRVTLEVLK